MKQISGFLILLGLVAAVPAFGEDSQIRELSSKVDEVTVYKDGALVVRNASFESEKEGSMTLVFQNLSPQVIDSTVRLSGEGTGKVSVKDIRVRRTSILSTNGRGDAEAEIQKIQDEINHIFWLVTFPVHPNVDTGDDVHGFLDLKQSIQRTIVEVNVVSADDRHDIHVALLGEVMRKFEKTDRMLRL